ncbi:hypothetical protein BJP41_09380 [Candidatus Williamhamiltonella defendens]|uniref:Uncharacterized protein n=1 Tax=Candidatus Williamhamiltonella defendens TaxID=138072 RepID=A0A2D3T9N3_9ENTR|nr:hypothetical protein BJP41_09380 [Candidatus Hamiltonella defensa]ATW32507.1 hypothetical protein BJP42_09690 [Candidatus Hamiltonella defensa]
MSDILSSPKTQALSDIEANIRIFTVNWLRFFTNEEKPQTVFEATALGRGTESSVRHGKLDSQSKIGKSGILGLIILFI